MMQKIQMKFSCVDTLLSVKEVFDPLNYFYILWKINLL